MKTESLEEFLARGGEVTKCETITEEKAKFLQNLRKKARKKFKRDLKKKGVLLYD